MKLYMIRHGQSEANLRDELALPTSPLTEKGIEDAYNAGELIKNISFDRVFVSPFLRAVQTQKTALPHVDGEILPLIHEFEGGNIEGQRYADVMEKYGEKFQRMLDIDDYTYFGGEDYPTVRRRARDFLTYIESLGCEKVAAFTHAGFILTLFDEIMNRPGKPDRNILCDNGSVNIFEYRNGKWYVIGFNITLKI